MKNLVSIIIPTYNRGHLILKSVNSILNQNYKNIELIVVDDGSTDDTKKKLEKIVDKRFKYVYQKNAGACSARNYGIKISNGDFIAFQDSDDIWHLDKLEKQMKIFQEYDTDVVICKLLCGNKKIPKQLKAGFLDSKDNLFGISTQTIVAKRKVFDDFTFDEELMRLQDFELIYRISKEYSIYCCDEGLVDYAIYNDSISNNPYKLYDACNMILNKHPEIKLHHPEIMSSMAHSLLFVANQIRKNNKKEARQFIKYSHQYKINIKLIIKTLMIYFGVYDFFKNTLNK